MMFAKTSRRRLLGGGMALAAGTLLGRGSPAWAAVQGATDLPSIPIPPPIAAAERVGRLNKARDLMRRAGIGAVLVESGPSLDYFTGIQWWRSERLTGVVIPAEGDPIIVTPFFERPSIQEMLQVPAEIRTCNRFLTAELSRVSTRSVLLALGSIAHNAALRALTLKPSEYKFAHAAEHELPAGQILLDSYHCSRYNTQTRRLTEKMFADVFARARKLVDGR